MATPSGKTASVFFDFSRLWRKSPPPDEPVKSDGELLVEELKESLCESYRGLSVM